MALLPLIANDLVRAHGPRRVLDGISLAASRGARIGLIGENGVGKSTLLRLLAGVEEPDEGSVQRRRRPVAATWPAMTGPPSRPTRRQARRGRAAAHAGLIAPRDLRTPVGALSTGQRRRLALAILLANPPHLLLLDEPTNHRSPMLADELQDAFGGAPGALVIASHDRRLRTRWADGQLQLPGS